MSFQQTTDILLFKYCSISEWDELIYLINFQKTSDVLLFKYCHISELDEFYLFDGLMVSFIENK